MSQACNDYRQTIEGVCLALLKKICDDVSGLDQEDWKNFDIKKCLANLSALKKLLQDETDKVPGREKIGKEEIRFIEFLIKNKKNLTEDCELES